MDALAASTLRPFNRRALSTFCPPLVAIRPKSVNTRAMATFGLISPFSHLVQLYS
jgi:hypothetical protein